MGRSDIKTTLADNLRALMARSNTLKTQSALSRKSGVAQSTISAMLQDGPGSAGRTLEKLDAVADALGVSAANLLTPRCPASNVQMDIPIEVEPLVTALIELYADGKTTQDQIDAIRDILRALKSLGASRAS
ncbi:helix-turn-helix domain-containing protein [Chitinimonas sp.]|uniref:helix-turn-helix domain-containing protein n=1 Tax=Chitinimonas sp. TaxID=1934313 RepID=UPI0035AE2182